MSTFVSWPDVRRTLEIISARDVRLDVARDPPLMLSKLISPTVSSLSPFSSPLPANCEFMLPHGQQEKRRRTESTTHEPFRSVSFFYFSKVNPHFAVYSSSENFKQTKEGSKKNKNESILSWRSQSKEEYNYNIFILWNKAGYTKDDIPLKFDI